MLLGKKCYAGIERRKIEKKAFEAFDYNLNLRSLDIAPKEIKYKKEIKALLEGIKRKAIEPLGGQGLVPGSRVKPKKSLEVNPDKARLIKAFTKKKIRLADTCQENLNLMVGGILLNVPQAKPEVSSGESEVSEIVTDSEFFDGNRSGQLINEFDRDQQYKLAKMEYSRTETMESGDNHGQDMLSNDNYIRFCNKLSWLKIKKDYHQNRENLVCKKSKFYNEIFLTTYYSTFDHKVKLIKQHIENQKTQNLLKEKPPIISQKIRDHANHTFKAKKSIYNDGEYNLTSTMKQITPILFERIPKHLKLDLKDFNNCYSNREDGVYHDNCDGVSATTIERNRINSIELINKINKEVNGTYSNNKDDDDVSTDSNCSIMSSKFRESYEQNQEIKGCNGQDEPCQSIEELNENYTKNCDAEAQQNDYRKFNPNKRAPRFKSFHELTHYISQYEHEQKAKPKPQTKRVKRTFKPTKAKKTDFYVDQNVAPVFLQAILAEKERRDNLSKVSEGSSESNSSIHTDTEIGTQSIPSLNIVTKLDQKSKHIKSNISTNSNQQDPNLPTKKQSNIDEFSLNAPKIIKECGHDVYISTWMDSVDFLLEDFELNIYDDLNYYTQTSSYGMTGIKYPRRTQSIEGILDSTDPQMVTNEKIFASMMGMYYKITHDISIDDRRLNNHPLNISRGEKQIDIFDDQIIDFNLINKILFSKDGMLYPAKFSKRKTFTSDEDKIEEETGFKKQKVDNRRMPFNRSSTLPNRKMTTHIPFTDWRASISPMHDTGNDGNKKPDIAKITEITDEEDGDASGCINIDTSSENDSSEKMQEKKLLSDDDNIGSTGGLEGDPMSDKEAEYLSLKEINSVRNRKIRSTILNDLFMNYKKNSSDKDENGGHATAKLLDFLNNKNLMKKREVGDSLVESSFGVNNQRRLSQPHDLGLYSLRSGPGVNSLNMTIKKRWSVNDEDEKS